MSLYATLLRPLLFQWDGERSHQMTLRGCAAIGHLRPLRAVLDKVARSDDPRLHTQVAGLRFTSPVGLAAGFDKNAQAQQVTAHLGFGFIEIGSVSLHPSHGNPGHPRVWRLPADKGLRIHYGCPSDGAGHVAERLRGAALPIPLGVSLVETNTGVVATAAHAIAELATAVAIFAGITDFLVLNLSCPNLPGGKGLFDDPDILSQLLASIAAQKALPPIFLKLTPPGTPNDPAVIDAILAAVTPFSFVAGFVLNIPIRDPGAQLRSSPELLARTHGGITGRALLHPTLAALRAWAIRIDRSRHVLIGVGGIASGADAYAMIRQGASLVQLYTALVYQGPGLVRRINRDLAALLDRDGHRSIAEAVGADLPH